jgi:hypothetical protein
MNTFQLDRRAAVDAIPAFLDLYRLRPVSDNRGGMGFNHSFATWFILRELQPSLVVESGVWKGHSTWLIEQACPGAMIVCLDLDFGRVQFRSAKADYYSCDFAEMDWSGFDLSRAIGFFDDHQNAYSRLKDLWWAGFRHAIFEDNYPSGEGDCYSLKKAIGGHGHPRPQMSKAYQPKGWFSKKRQNRRDSLIASIGPRQQVVVPPNTADFGNFKRRLDSYLEFPPVLLGPRTSWGSDWNGAYATVEPLLGLQVSRFADMIRSFDPNLFYCYISYVALKG